MLVRQHDRRPELLTAELTAHNQISSSHPTGPVLRKLALIAAAVVSARKPSAHLLLHDRSRRAPAASPALVPQPRIVRARSAAQLRTPNKAGKPVFDVSRRNDPHRLDLVLELLRRVRRRPVFVVEDEFAVAAIAAVTAAFDELDRLLGSSGVGILCGVCCGAGAGHARDFGLGRDDRVAVLLLFQD